MAMTTVGDYLVRRLEQAGVSHVFGVPGDYVLDFMDRIVESPLELVNTCNELDAGYAADGYARIRGISGVVVTYGVGGLSVLNAVAGAYAERVPMVVISGAPHSRLRHDRVMIHHLVENYQTQINAFRQVTACAEMLTDAGRATEQIDRAVKTCLHTKRPVYIEIPVDLVDQQCSEPSAVLDDGDHRSNHEALAEAVAEAASMLAGALRPAVFIGMEVRRFRLLRQVTALLEKGGYPIATTIGGKTAIAETHPHYVGVYQGGFSEGLAHDTIEQADVLLCLGAWMTDMTTGGFTAHLDPYRMINANADRIRIRHHFYEQVFLEDFVEGLTAAIAAAEEPTHRHTPPPYICGGIRRPEPDRPLTVARFFDRIGSFLDNSMIVVSDTGDVMFGSTCLHREEPESYFAQDYYLSIGYSLPAALGLGLAAKDKRPVVLIGDGALQMTVQELSTICRYSVNAIVFVLNNSGYATERLIHDGPYNEIHPWAYHRLPEALGCSAGILARTEGELETALEAALQRSREAVLVEVVVGRTDSSETLSRVGEQIRKLSSTAGKSQSIRR
jgi:TPP-dependent 2-oxoacid decarboxylase